MITISIFPCFRVLFFISRDEKLYANVEESNHFRLFPPLFIWFALNLCQVSCQSVKNVVKFVLYLAGLRFGNGKGVHLTACKSKLDLAGRYFHRSEIISGVKGRFQLNTSFSWANIGWKTPETSKWWTSETVNPGNGVGGQVSGGNFSPSVIETF